MQFAALPDVSQAEAMQKIKVRGCADGLKQQIYKAQHESSASAVHTESLFLPCTIEVKKRYMAMTCNIPAAFMQANMEKMFFMKLKSPNSSLG